MTKVQCLIMSNSKYLLKQAVKINKRKLFNNANPGLELILLFQ